MSYITTSEAFAALKQAIHDDPEYAWSWHCNLAMPIFDAAEVSHAKASQAAALIMAQAFNYDITQHPRYSYEKNPHQEYFEMRCAADAEDAA